MARKEISELGAIAIETAKAKKQRGKKKKQLGKKTRLSKNWGQLHKVQHTGNGNTRRKERKQ